MPDIVVKPFNEVYVKLETGKSIEFEIQEKFSFLAQNYRFTPKFKAGTWDGRIRLYNRKDKTFYKGLVERLAAWADESTYSMDDADQVIDNGITDQDIHDFLDEINLNPELDRRDYQIEAIRYCLNKNRATLLCPTSGGKSFIIYTILRMLNIRTLIIVPRISLTVQMEKDFASYSTDDWVDGKVSKIYGGQDKHKLNQITLSTWQSCYEMPKDWFTQFDCVICDEVHEAKSASIKKIMEMMTDCVYRFGFTGTLDGIDANEQTIEGCFGPIHRVITTAELIEQGYASTVSIKCISLGYNAQSKKDILLYDEKKKKLKRDYTKEKNFLLAHKTRCYFLIKLALSLKGNTLMLFKDVEKHGDVLYNLASANRKNSHNIFYTYGGTSVDEREQIRMEMDKRYDDINQLYIASLGTTSTGINIKNIDNIIFAAPSKSRIKVLQSIGRGLRKSSTKYSMTLYDVFDDLRLSKSNTNYTYNHFIERLKMYSDEQFPYEIIQIPLEK